MSTLNLLKTTRKKRLNKFREERMRRLLLDDTNPVLMPLPQVLKSKPHNSRIRNYRDHNTFDAILPTFSPRSPPKYIKYQPNIIKSFDNFREVVGSKLHFHKADETNKFLEEIIRTKGMRSSSNF